MKRYSIPYFETLLRNKNWKKVQELVRRERIGDEIQGIIEITSTLRSEGISISGRLQFNYPEHNPQKLSFEFEPFGWDFDGFTVMREEVEVEYETLVDMLPSTFSKFDLESI